MTHKAKRLEASGSWHYRGFRIQRNGSYGVKDWYFYAAKDQPVHCTTLTDCKRTIDNMLD